MPGVCFRCLREVYFAEEKLALGKVWHTFCFRCRKCRKLLDSCTVQTQNGEIFCKSCLSSTSLRKQSEKSMKKRNCEVKSPKGKPLKDVLLRGDCCYCCTRNCFLASNGAGDGLIGQKSIDSKEKPRLRGGGGRTEETSVDQRTECAIKRCCEGNESKLAIPCNQQPSPTAITAWYNQKQTNSQSSSTFEYHICNKNEVLLASKSAEQPEVLNAYARSTIVRSGSVCRQTFQEQHEKSMQQRQEPPSKIDDQKSKSLQFQSTLDGSEKQQPSFHDREGYTSQRLRVDNTFRKGKPWAYPPLPPNYMPPPRRVSFSDAVLEDVKNVSFFNAQRPQQYEHSVETGNDNRNHQAVDEEEYACSDCDCCCTRDDDEFDEKKMYLEEDALEESRNEGKVDRMRGGCGGSVGLSTENCACGRGGESDRSKRDGSAPREEPQHRSHTKMSSNSVCGGAGSCGTGCRGGCGKTGHSCLPLKTRFTPTCTRRVPSRLNWSSPRSSTPRPHHRTESPAAQSTGLELEVPDDRCGRVERQATSDDDEIPESSGSRRSKTTTYENLGGGSDCQRCGRKVYQAEMQIAAGARYHNICFSCYCCRKPVEPLTFQENCGQIYCKHCHIRKFGPQGYGYGIGAGVLQTPM